MAIAPAALEAADPTRHHIAVRLLPFLFILEILSQSAAAAAVGMINAVGSVAGFAGPYVFGYLHTRTGSLSYGLALMMVSALAGGLLILCTPRSARAVVR